VPSHSPPVLQRESAASGNTDCLSSFVVDATGLLGKRFYLQAFTARLSFFTLRE
jgi:hypothetical protein